MLKSSSKKKRFSEFSVKFFAGILLANLSFTSIENSAQAAEDDDYNFSWLDPDKKIYVLQNRRFRKADSLHLYLLGGTAFGEPYRTVYSMQPRVGYWFNEEMGMEVFYSARFHKLNNTYKAMIAASGSGSTTQTPLIREVTSQIGVLFNWAPWYAKINVFNSVMYFDWYFTLGFGSMTSDIGPGAKDDPLYTPQWKSENLFAVYAGTGHLFHFSEKFITRLDVLGHFYSAEVFGGQAGQARDKSIFSSFNFNLGVGLKL